jgi:aspartyl-tRNA(Asn)/glutamyl-tRNA(Gln) amidotransferase subunit B
MEEGSLRCDANVSVRRHASDALGVKIEVKNINSFRYVQRAIEYEIERQAEVLARGGALGVETRLWDAASGRTFSMRTKEEAHDYRYFPEPDLPPLLVTEAEVARLRGTLPELPEQMRDRFVVHYGLPPYDADVLTQSAALARYYEATAAASGNAKAASNWIMVEVLGRLNAEGRAVTDIPLAPAALGGLIRLIDSGRITGPIAKQVFERMFATGEAADTIVAAEGLARLDDAGAIAALVSDAIAANPKPVAQYRAGKRQTFGFLVGQVMKASRGTADPEKVAEALRRALDD